MVQDRVDARADEVQDAGDVVQTLKRRHGAGEAHRQLDESYRTIVRRHSVEK